MKYIQVYIELYRFFYKVKLDVSQKQIIQIRVKLYSNIGEIYCKICEYKYISIMFLIGKWG